jgi:hypothetical protein
MIPPIPSKQLLSIRSITTIVFDKIAEETAEINMMSISEIIPFSTPANTTYMIILAYYLFSVYRKYSVISPVREEKREKNEQLDKYLLTDMGYRSVKIWLTLLFWLIRDPRPVV